MGKKITDEDRAIDRKMPLLAQRNQKERREPSQNTGHTHGGSKAAAMAQNQGNISRARYYLIFSGKARKALFSY
jgi:hypothetical protein